MQNVIKLLFYAYKMVILHKNLFFNPLFEVDFAKKTQKISNVGKLTQYDEKEVFFRGKNIFSFQKCIFTKLGKRKTWK